MQVKRRVALSALLALGVVGLPAAGLAKSGGATASYSTGWNMVGGPSGSDFSAARALYIYGPSGYQTASSMQTVLCQGYWADFAEPTSVALPASTAGSIVSCSLQPGWNLVGNPFTSPAQLPVGTTAYYWDPAGAAYNAVTEIPPGGSVWIYAGSATSVELQPAPPGGSLVITTLNRGPYQVHVGETVTLVLAGDFYIATTTSSLLQLVASGQDNQGQSYWTWLATAPGAAFITLAPKCLQSHPPCAIAVPDLEIEVDILP